MNRSKSQQMSPAMHPDTTTIDRRALLTQFGMGFGGLAAAQLIARQTMAAPQRDGLHFPAKARRVIYLFQSGGPSQLETFDYKPLLNQQHGEPLPDSVRQGQRLTGMSGNQAILPLAGSKFGFQQHGNQGTWVCDLLPHTAKIIDKLTIIRSMYTEAINHDPAITFFQTGSQIAGRPSLGSWVDYGLGTENEDLPAFVVLITRGRTDQPLYARLWGSGFLPSRHQGVQLRSGSEPVLYLADPPGVSREGRRQMLDAIEQLHEHQLESTPDEEIRTRIAQYEMAFRMQRSLPEVASLADEPQHVLDLYGPDVKTPGTFAFNCLMARRLAERNVRFIQLYHQGWDHHGGLPGAIQRQCMDTDQPSAGLLTDLEQRGLLKDTLVVWGGEFGRTNYSQGKLTPDGYGRDHHPRCFTMWMAGGGAKPGVVHGETCEYGYNVIRDGVHVHDFQATLLHLLGVDHEQLVYKYQGRRFRLTDVHGQIIQPLLA
jgi:hypothetical protein